MDIKWSSDFINEKIKATINNKNNKKIITKSTTVEKAIALINIKLKERLDNLKYEDRETLNLFENEGITIIVELDYPLTTKNEQHLENIYHDKGYFFQYKINENKEKYFICIGSKR